MASFRLNMEVRSGELAAKATKEIFFFGLNVTI